MKTDAIDYKEIYGSERFYRIMLQIKKDFPDKKELGQLLLFFPMYKVAFEVIETEMNKLKLKLQYSYENALML
jgi:hypothetical protein